jgi:hypothetical protein
MRLVRRPQAALAIAFAQFLHQMLEMGRQTQRFRTKVLLQPFADGVADRPARFAIDPCAAVADSGASQDLFRFLSIE